MARSITRSVTSGIAVAGLVAGAALAGAGVANAQHTVTFNSPSTLSLDRNSAGQVLVGYENRSGTDLGCAFVVSNASVVDGLDRHLRDSADPVGAFIDPDTWPAALQTSVTRAIEAEEFNIGEGAVAEDYSGIVSITGGTDFPMDTTFPLHGLSMCADESNPSAVYVEFERTSGGGVFGSLGNLFGSAS